MNNDRNKGNLPSEQLAQPGSNRTVRNTADYVERMVEGTKEFGPTSKGSAHDIAEVRVDYATEGEPLGHLPRHAPEDDALAALLVDKLGERLAFERTGVRLYDALLSKHEAYGSFDGGPSYSDLERFRSEELAHMQILTTAIKRVDSDPNALTPAADNAFTAGIGLCQVLTDPRTTLVQSLEAILIAELTDHECWEGLVELAESAGEAELVDAFRLALADEVRHLDHVRSWVAAAQGRRKAGAAGERSS
ncbi:MAG TPA: ferritin-like domain-containing protein [Planctomycetota bacterium]|nr:ferritin-like domain-containing protein [Planctomycetota bacterium]